METSLSKLQKVTISQEKRIIKLQDCLEEQKRQKIEAQKMLQYYKDNTEKMLEQAVNKANAELLEENQKLKNEIEHLKRILNHDSNNCGIPTSKTPIGRQKRIPNSRQVSSRTKGGQIGHKKSKLEKFSEDEITETRVYSIEQKCECGGNLKLIGKRCKDEFDIDIRLNKIRHEFCEYECDCCHHEIKVPVPKHLKEENQYGSNLQALAVSLVNEGCVSFHRVKELISGFTNNEVNMSEGYIVKLQKRCYEKLADFDNELHKKILQQSVINWDDTVIDINKKQSCLRFYGTDKLAYYKAHEKKDKIGLDEDQILQNLSKYTVVVHDHNKVNYNDDYDFTNAECCVHLIRDLKELNENLPRTWIDKLINLLITTNNKRKDYINQSIMYFDQEVSDKVIEEYDQIISEAQEINKNNFNSYYGHDEQKIIKRLIEYKQNYLLWVLRFDVPFSNNLSERSLRSSKTKMKVSGQFSNLTNAEYYARIKSYIETCKRNNINPHSALQRLIDDNPYTIEEMKID